MILFCAMTGPQHKIVLITGGTGGLGQTLAEAFGQRQNRVVIIARDRDRLHAAAEKMARNGAQVLALPCDISRRDEVCNLEKEITGRWGDVQILINNAGIARAVSFADMPDPLWDETLATNLTVLTTAAKFFYRQ